MKIFPQSVVTGGENGNGLKIEKKYARPIYQVIKLCLENIATKYCDFISLLNVVCYLRRNSEEAFCVRVEVLSNDFRTEWT